MFIYIHLSIYLFDFKKYLTWAGRCLTVFIGSGTVINECDKDVHAKHYFIAPIDQSASYEVQNTYNSSTIFEANLNKNIVRK